MPGLLAWRARLGLSTIRRPSSMAASVVARPLSLGTGSARFRSARAPLCKIALSALQGGEEGPVAARREREVGISASALESPLTPACPRRRVIPGLGEAESPKSIFQRPVFMDSGLPRSARPPE